MDFSGRLSTFSVGDLLQWAKNDRCTGALVFRRSEREKRIYFVSGAVVGCLSNDPAEYYGQHLLLAGHLTQDQLFKALHLCNERSERLGAALRELELLSDEVIQQTLREQIEDTICDLFLWERGVFYFQAEIPQDEAILPEPIHVVGLALEGTRWKDEVARMRLVLIHDNVVLRRGTVAPQPDELSPVEARVLRDVDGRRTVGELYQRIKGSYFRFLSAAFRLCVDRVLDIEAVGEAVDGSTHEISVYDLLLERATEEQILVARRHMAVPLDLLERSYPVWVGEPTAEESTRMPARARDFYARLDGKTSLGEAFSGEARHRGKELDLLLLQLQKGRLAILPAPVDQLEVEAEKRGQPVHERWWRRVFKPGG
jgi:hypothetical protein